MAITLSQILDFAGSSLARLDVRGSTFVGVVELLGDASYPTGGYPVTPALLGLNAIQFAVAMCTNGIYMPVWDQVNSKVKLFSGDANATYRVNGPFAEIPNATNVATVKIYLLISGT